MGLILSAAVTLTLGLGSRLAAQTSADTMSREMLAAHNQVRAGVRLPPLVWSPELAAVAQQWANELLAGGRSAHRPKHQYGENLFEIRGGRSSPTEVVASWAAEARDYDLARNTCRARAQCGHYTQIVWRNTKEVGCGAARLPGREVWVCNYSPPGNWIGERPYRLH